MAIVQVNFMPDSLKQQTTVQAVIPIESDKSAPLKTLYLLHGIFGDCNDWLIRTRIEQLANKHHIAVIMPSATNSFYVDNQKRHEFYGRYVGEELVEYTRRLFPLSARREDTYIGGLSMGGYGAIRNGLKYSDNFSAIIGLSSGLVHYLAPYAGSDDKQFFKNRDYYESVFGDLDKLLVSDKNPEVLLQNLIDQKKEIPKIYLACGTEDELLEVGRKFQRFAVEKGADVTYLEGPGIHDWRFWDTYIEKAMQWLSEIG